ncbi:hypothetical protein DYL59_26670 [Pseudomonas kairouanensis]|uniref:HNH endonuclease n=2 Tax=Pseudomonas kairouanensis TaxID=2293832 RepID=A0A4Z0AFT3_9PSED|nr:hypothetical protein DYL59_26670 [Pseudomonas kairouanensis]
MRQRAGEACSNPECRVPTSGPCGSEKVTSIGVAAHIHAAAPGGKRYLASMTSEERIHINNGIWLCSNCSVIIDRDVEIYPAELLLKWKTSAEDKAKDSLGKRPQASDAAIGKLLEALENRQPKLSLAGAIAKAHREQEQFLERLDHRFSVTSSLVDGISLIEIKAREPVRVRFHINAKQNDGYEEGLKNLFDHGKKLEINLLDASVQGSNLLSHLVSEDPEGGKLVFSPLSRDVSARVELIDPETDLVDHLTEVNGQITGGEKSLAFEGKAFEGLITIGFRKNLMLHDDTQTISLHIDLTLWEEQKLGSLPYLAKIAKLYQRLANGWELSLIIEHRGEVVFSGASNFNSCRDDIRALNAFLAYTTRARSISMLLEKQIIFTRHITFSPVELANLEEIRRILENQGQIPEENLIKPMIIDVNYDETINQFEILGGKKPGTLRFVENEHNALVVFDQVIKLPRKVLLVEGFIPEIKRKKGKMKTGDNFKLILKPIDGYAMTCLYDHNI